jgi:hypothetical protein
MQEASTIERRGLAKGLKIWIDLLFYLALVAGIVILVTGPIVTLAGSRGLELSIPVSIGESSFLPILPLQVDPDAGSEIHTETSPDVGPFSLVHARGELRFSETALTPLLVYWVHQLVLFGALICGLILLRRILATAVEGRPFDPSNPLRLNRLGWLVVVTGLLVPVSQFFFGGWALTRYQVTGIALSPSMEIYEEWVFAGLLVLILAAIWKEAVRMAEDLSLTV